MLVVAALAQALVGCGEPPTRDQAIIDFENAIAGKDFISCTDPTIAYEFVGEDATREFAVKATCRTQNHPDPVDRYFEVKYARYPGGWQFDEVRDSSLGKARLLGTKKPVDPPFYRRGSQLSSTAVLAICFGVALLAFVLIALLLRARKRRKNDQPVVARRISLKSGQIRPLIEGQGERTIKSPDREQDK